MFSRLSRDQVVVYQEAVPLPSSQYCLKVTCRNQQEALRYVLSPVTGEVRSFSRPLSPSHTSHSSLHSPSYSSHSPYTAHSTPHDDCRHSPCSSRCFHSSKSPASSQHQSRVRESPRSLCFSSKTTPFMKASSSSSFDCTSSRPSPYRSSSRLSPFDGSSPRPASLDYSSHPDYSCYSSYFETPRRKVFPAYHDPFFSRRSGDFSPGRSSAPLRITPPHLQEHRQSGRRSTSKFQRHSPHTNSCSCPEPRRTASCERDSVNKQNSKTCSCNSAFALKTSSFPYIDESPSPPLEDFPSSIPSPSRCSGTPHRWSSPPDSLVPDERSSAVKHERVCPGGGGGRCGGSGLTKAYSSEGPHYGAQQQLINPLHHHHHNGTHLQHRRPQVLSQSALGGGGSRRGAAVDDSGGIRPGRRGNAPAGAQTYELSQDLADKRIEMLERSYGGDQARRAATTIQRAYRHYAMTKKFRAITATAKAPERRLSRRFQGEASTSPGGTRNGTVPVNGDAAVHYRDTEQFIRSEFDELNKNLSAIYGDGRSQPRPTRTGSLRDSGRPSADTSGSADAAVNHSSSLEDSDNAVFYHNQSIDSSVIANDNLVKVPSSSSNDGTNINEGGNGTNLTVSVTNSSISSQDSGLPSNTALDNSNASPKDLKYFSSEDSGFGSHEGRGSGGLGARRVNKGGKKLPPEVPRRSSSIKSSESGHSADSYMGSPLPPNSRYQWASPASPSCFTPPLYATPDRGCLGRERSRSVERAVMRRCPDNGSLSSVQSSGSDSSLSQSASDRATPLSVHDNPDSLGELHIPTSPVWKRKNQMSTSELVYEDKRLSNISENSEDSCQSHSSDRLTYSQTAPSHNTRYPPYHAAQLPKVPEVLRKRQYRVGLNLFNKKPERGITYLINRYFLENSPLAVAKFLLTRKGLSKQMIGEYLGNLQNSFNMAVLEMFSQEIDLSGMQVDVALRKYQTYFRLPGEAQKIERLMQVFAQRYCQCNPDIIANLRDPETVFVLAFAIIMLNTDLHTASMKQEKRMKVEDFVKNLRGVDDGYDIDREMLEGMYQRIKAQEFRTGHDHVTQVMKVQQTMVEKRPNLALPHRRLVCYCRLYEVPDSSKKERAGLHQREVFLFNDLLVVTKIFSKKKNSVTYSFRQSFPLAGLSVLNKETPHYQYLIEIKQRVDQKLLIAFNARNEHDRSKFCEDLKESISEMDEMENLRIEGELEKTKASLRASRPTSTAENRDSGVADMEVISTGSDKSTLNTDGATSSGTLSAGTLKRTTLSNSLIDMHEAGL